ncbi:16715_t:CDS:2 [Funneliformis caledonium]|uniref:16715_t:CDS:1 n=1 Tax=Funneliformis caledonium TaxID=1117310 RepID=A0A9N9HFE1_9GLOM|nr:16715_t:CDS:2 [Funneliformis caledonium]
MVKSSTTPTFKKQIKSSTTPLSSKKSSITSSLPTKGKLNSTINELSTIAKATSPPKKKSKKVNSLKSTSTKHTKKNKNGSNSSNNDKYKLKEPNEMEIDNNDLSDDSIDFGMTGGDMDEELFNLKIDASTSDDDENSKVDGSDIDSVIESNDENVKINESDNMDIDQKSGRENLNEELLDDEEGKEDKFKRQKNQEPGPAILLAKEANALKDNTKRSFFSYKSLNSNKYFEHYVKNILFRMKHYRLLVVDNLESMRNKYISTILHIAGDVTNKEFTMKPECEIIGGKL